MLYYTPLYYLAWNIMTVTMTVIWILFLLTVSLIIFYGDWKSN